MEGETDDEDPSAENSTVDDELLDEAWRGNVERVKQLLAMGGNIECFSDTGDTPLHLAIENTRLDVVRVLVSAGADVDRRTASGHWTPLAHAVDIVSDAASQMNEAPDNSLIRLLVQAGANPNARTSDGKTPLDIAHLYRNAEAEAILIAAGAAQ